MLVTLQVKLGISWFMAVSSYSLWLLSQQAPKPVASSGTPPTTVTRATVCGLAKLLCYCGQVRFADLL